METSQIVLTALGLLFGGGTLGILLTQLFMRRKTLAEADKTSADAHKSEAEASASYLEQVQSATAKLLEHMSRSEAQHALLIECRNEKSAALISLRESESEKERLSALAESYRLQIEVLQNRETELVGQLRDAKRSEGGQ